MAYTPINFKNKQSGGTPVSAANLNHMEDGIKQAHDLVPTESGSVGQVLTKTSTGTSWQDADNLPEGGTEGQVLTRTANDGAEWTDAGNPTASQVAEATSAWLDEHITEIPATAPIVDTSLKVSGAAADSQTVGNEISDLKSALEQGGTNKNIKNILLLIASVLRNAIYKADMSSVITQIENLINESGSDDDPTQPVVITQSGTVLTLSNVPNITSVSQSGTILTLN